jgi:outer membrane lipoprotein SlyB
MRLNTLFAAALVVPLLGSGCVVTTTRSTTWSDTPAQSWTRYGRVESIRETVRETRGDPAGGALAGAIIGGLIGSTIGGGPYGHGNPAGAVVGAMTGAVVGANASQGQATQRTYEAFIRFEDGSTQSFVYAGSVPFRPGDEVVQTEQGLYPR